MNRIVIDYNKLLELVEACRITRHGSNWIDASRLIDGICQETNTVRASTPNNIDEIISNGEKALKRGERYASTLEALAGMFGVTRQTLDNWRGARVIKLEKKEIGGCASNKCQYDLKTIVKDLRKRRDNFTK